MNEEELDAYITKIIDSELSAMLELSGGGAINGRKAESVEIMGSVAVGGGIDRISGENVLQG